MTAGKRLRRHMGRVEYLACKETVDTMLAQGFSKKLIHERLTEGGQFSMALSRSARYSSMPVKSPLPGQVRKPYPVPVHPQRQPCIIKAGPEPIQDPRTVDPKSIFKRENMATIHFL
jgi:hypothetical protein